MFRDQIDFMEKATNAYHRPVLLREVITLLAPSEGKVFVDGTFGGGGHTRALIEAGASVIAFDQDPEAIEQGRELAVQVGGKLRLIQANFRDASAHLQFLKIEKVDGILLDIGVSSHQIDVAQRGFSFQQDGPLDMRMSEVGESAATLVNEMDEAQLTEIFREYGEEPFAKRIARRIVADRSESPMLTTGDLANCVLRAVGRRGPKHPATKIFQALRIAVNDEIGALRDALKTLPPLLGPGGRFGVISFHSLEDREVKEFFRHHSAPTIDDISWPAPKPNPAWWFKGITRKPIMAGDEETADNPRARSAKLRVVERRAE
jgi:16S rRNA (cytosine1402-N4)-methyltransferase